MGSKLGIDATSNFAGEAPFGDIIKPAFKENHPGLEGFTANFSLTRENLPVLVLGIEKENANIREVHQELSDSGALHGIHWLVYVDPEAVHIRMEDIVWLVANNIDPLRDCFYATSQNGQPTAPMAIDGTGKSLAADGFKRQWPNVVAMDDETIQYIDENWKKLGLGNFLPSPSLNYKVLVKNDGAVARG